MIRIALSLLLATTTTGALARDYEAQAERALRNGQPAVTVFVDADWGGREDGAAREITKAHVAFAAKGFEVIDIESYTENGDLEGFFVTYRRLPRR